MSTTARVFVTLKTGVLDPQGDSIHDALKSLGFNGIRDVRVGKLIEISFEDGQNTEALTEQLKQMSAKLLANPVIEKAEVQL